MSTYLFHVLEPKKGQFVIEWRLLEEAFMTLYGQLAGFLYWAERYEATYRIRPPLTFGSPVRKPFAELHAVSGTCGEYHDKIYWEPGSIFRMLSGSHYLTQHGLDGLPQRYIEKLYGHPQPIFKVEPYKGGVFSMTMDDWLQHFYSGQNADSLDALGQSVTL